MIKHLLLNLKTTSPTKEELKQLRDEMIRKENQINTPEIPTGINLITWLNSMISN